ncbi:hypothetical protein ACFTZF_15790 [Streptomyces mirabilis]|uniref:hypothetical protein n=1 Tax=Streptomyces mirabilis TaxID=68239 RepID=UPI00362EF38F
MTRLPEFISLNGPDNVGKTTQLERLAARSRDFQLLGSVHGHDVEPWRRVATDDYAAWWFERSTTTELTRMLLDSHAKRANARGVGRVGLLDRGLPMLLAVSAATCSLKDGLTVPDALARVVDIAAREAHPPETAILLMPALDAERSYAITSAREARPWTGVYPSYQRTLHQVLLHQAEEGAYTAVVDCEGSSVEGVHAGVIGNISTAILAPETH